MNQVDAPFVTFSGMFRIYLKYITQVTDFFGEENGTLFHRRKIYGENGNYFTYDILNGSFGDLEDFYSGQLSQTDLSILNNITDTFINENRDLYENEHDMFVDGDQIQGGKKRRCKKGRKSNGLCRKKSRSARKTRKA
jgi:hypothetical protein